MSSLRILTTILALLLSAGLWQAEAQALNIQFQRYTTTHGLISNRVLSVAQDKAGYIVVHTPAGSSRFDGYRFKNSPEFARNPYRPARTPLPPAWRKNSHLPDSARAFHRDTLGRIWLATDHGLLVYQPHLDSVSQLNHLPENHNSLSDDHINCLFEDGSGNLWVGTEKGGLNKANLYAQPFRNFAYFDFGQAEGNIKVYSFCLHDDTLIWLGTNKGLYLYDRFRGRIAREWRTFSDPSATRTLGTVLDIDQGEDGLAWLATRGGGVLSFDLETETFRHRSGLIGRKEKASGDDEVRTVLRTSRDSVWFGSYSGTFLIDANTDTTLYAIHGLRPKFCPKGASKEKGTYSPAWYSWELRRESQCIFYSCNASGLVRHDFCERTAIVYETGDTTFPDGRRDVFTYYDDHRNYFWLGTYGNGVFRLDTASCEMRAFSVEDGLPDNYVYSLLEDESGKIWSSTNQGIFCTDPRKARIESYALADGLAVTEFETGSFYRCPAIPGRKEELFFGGINGFVHFFPDEIRPRMPQPIILLTAITVLGNEIPFDEEQVRSLSIRSDSATLTFGFSSTDYVQPSNNRFQYRLTGYEDTWSPASTVNLARYSNLPPGDYTFEVLQQGMAVSHKLHLVVRPQWFEILALQIGTAVFVILTVALLIRRRIQKVRRQGEQRRRLAVAWLRQRREQVRWNSLLTLDFIGSINQLILARELRVAESFIVGFDRMLRAAVNRSPERPSDLQDEVQMLRRYLELEAIHHRNRFSYTVNIDERIDQHAVEIPGGFLQPFVRAALEEVDLAEAETLAQLRIHFRAGKDSIHCLIHCLRREPAEGPYQLESQIEQSFEVAPLDETIRTLNELNPYHARYSAEKFVLLDKEGVRIGNLTNVAIPVDPDALSPIPDSQVPP